MAEYDRRPRRGVGHFNNNRKRRYRDDDFEDRRQQRRRYEEPIAVTVRKTILSIAEARGRRVEDDVPYVAKAIADNYFDSDLISGFLDLIVQMPIEQPLRIPFLAAIVLHVNASKPEFTPEILNKISEALQKHVTAGAWRNVKLYMRLMGCMQTLFEGDGIFPLLEQFFERAADLQMQSSDDSLGLELVKIILLSIPYTMASPANGLENLANSLLEKTDVIASTPHALESLVDPFPTFALSGSTSSESALSLLQKHMQQEAKANWPLSCLPRPWRVPKAEDEEDALANASKHSFPEITLPPTILAGSSPIYPEIYFSVYADQEIATTPPPTDPSSILIRDTLTDTIEVLDFNRSEAARFLIDIDRYLAPGTFVESKTPFDKVREVAGDKPMWKPEDVIVDACFAMLFALPNPEHKYVYYHSVLTEACKLEPQAVAPSLGRAIRFLYRNVERMDVELSHRFLDWFAHHLSNFGFTWKWTEWVEDVGLVNVHPKKAFMLESLDKEMRLSFAQRIKGTLPAEVADLIDAEREKDAPEYKYAGEVQYGEEAREIAKLIRQKASKDEMMDVLGKVEGRLKQIDVLVTTATSVGSKSLSHFLNVVERTKDVFVELVGDETSTPGKPESEKQIVKSILEFWAHQPGNGVMVVDKLLNYLLVSPDAVVEAVLADLGGVTNAGRVLSKGWAWEMVERVLGKVVGRVRRVVAAYRKPGLEDAKRDEIHKVLDSEVLRLKTLVELVIQRVAGIAETVPGLEALTDEEKALVTLWCGKWRVAVKRRGDVEVQWVKEEMGKPIPLPPPEPAVDVEFEVEPQGAREEGGGPEKKVKRDSGGDRDGDVGMNGFGNGMGNDERAANGENGVKEESEKGMAEMMEEIQ